jgi:HK97 family phage prohead protease
MLMPIPKPSSGESESDFMARCTGDSTMLAEYSQRDQRVAVCLSSYREGGKEETVMDEALVEDFTDDFDDEMKSETLDVQAELKAYNGDDEEEKGVFSGYGSIFGNKDLGNDVMMQGAFAKSIASKGPKGVKLLYQHDAKEPIGVFDEIIEDRKGLRVKGRLAMGTQKGREVYELMKMGAIDGLSIGYRVSPKGADYDERGKKRMLKEVDLMEISAVTFPMNTRARVQAVKGEQRTVREWEETMRDACGLSRSESKVAANAVFKALDQREVGDEQKDVIDSMAKLTKILKGD